jgi:tetratricopeptide (TPR) repeat protein
VSPEQLYRQALELANSGRSRDALRALEELVMQHPNYAIAHNDLGVLYQQEGDLAKARRHQEEAHRLQPDNSIFQKNLADLLYIACGETEAALNLYVGILGSNPRDVEVLQAISQICMEGGRPDDARSFLDAILKIEPWNSQARESLAALSIPAHKVPVSPNAGRSDEEVYAEAQQRVQQGRLNEAHLLMEELVLRNSGNALYHNDLGVVCYNLGDIKGAQRAYEQAVKLQPANSTYHKNLADLCFAELGMVDEAIGMYLELFMSYPRDLDVLSSLGYICTAVGRPEEAKMFYRRALEIEPWNAEIRAALQQIA